MAGNRIQDLAYTYDNVGNITQIVDESETYTKKIADYTYDGLGRRLTAEDLHDPEDEYFGQWSYSYDDSGNLTSHTDPKSQTVNWTYDDLNRVLTENYTGQSGTEVTYTYDQGTDGIGRLSSAVNADADTTYTYNALGGVETEAKEINSVEYDTEYAYDRQGNQTLITYPNEAEVKYLYNTAGLLELVQQKQSGEENFSNLVSDYDYSPLEQVSYQEDANGVKTYNDYDAAKLYRLQEKITASPDEGGFGDLYGIAMVTNLQMGYGSTNNSSNSQMSLPGITDNPAVQAVGSLFKSAFGTVQGALSAPETPDPVPDKNQKLDFWGKPIDYKLPKDETIYLKYDKTQKPKELPKEAIEFLDKNAGKVKEPELKSYLPPEAVEELNKESSDNGENMLLSGTPPDESTDLNSENKWLSENIIYNQGFEDGFDHWTFQNNLDATHQEDCTESHAGSCSEKIVVNTAGQFWQVQLVQTLKLVVNTNYKLKFWAKGGSSQFPEIKIEASQYHSPYNNLGLWVTGERIYPWWTEYEYSFTATATDELAAINFHLGETANATYWFDEIEVIPDTFNKIKNPSFENSTTSWGFTSFGGGAGEGTNGLDCVYPQEGRCDDHIDMSVEGNYWEVSLYQPTDLDSSKTYVLSFYAWASNGRHAKVALAQNHSPWYDLTPEIDFNVSYPWQKYEVELTPSQTDSNGRLIFYVGEDEPDIYFDNVKLREKQAIKISDSTPEFSTIYDDPDAGDYATDYQIQVIKYDGVWSSPIWDSGKTEFNENVLEGDRTEDISYGGDPLRLDGMKYYWRIKLWDDEDNEGPWTNGKDYFIMQGKKIQDLAYTYDNVGNITQIVDESETYTKKIADYTYDDLYRLTSAEITNSGWINGDYTRTFSYDSLGNFINKSDAGDYSYEGNTGTSYANPHAVTSIDSAAVDYDNNGNNTSVHWGEYVLIGASYDYNNRIISTLRPDNQTATYKYDHSGQRIEQNINSGDKITVYPNKYYETTTEGENTTETLNIYALGQLIGTAVIEDSSLSLYFVHPDHLNSSSVMTNFDETGSIDQVIDYYPYGNIRFNEQNSNEDQTRKFTGHEYDDNTTLQYFGARYYQGDVGRFWSEDPAFLDLGGTGNTVILLNPQMLNSYSYAINNPIVNEDRDGKTPGSFALIVAYIAMHQFISNTSNIPHSIREADFVVSHPIAASQIGTAKDGSSSNLSSISSNFAVNLTKSDMGYGDKQSHEGTERNAIRHTVWQGILTNSFGSNTAEQAGNSHEYNPFADLSARSFSNMGLADQSADLLNNQIGRDIASNTPGLSSQQIAQKSLDYFHGVGLYTVQNPSPGVYNVVQTKISDQQYKNSSQALRNLGNNGLTK